MAAAGYEPPANGVATRNNSYCSIFGRAAMGPSAEDGHATLVAAQLAQMQLNEATAPGLSCWQERRSALLARRDDNQAEGTVRADLPTHLFVLVHGNNGHPTDFDVVAAALVAQFPPGSIAILQSNVNMRQKTRAGIAQCGHRLALEILTWLLTFRVPDTSSPRRLSMLGHSFGGLIARHCLPFLLHTLSAMHIQPTSFVTLCTPHLGSRKPGGSLPRVFSKWLVHRILLTQRLYGQTGLDLLVLGTSTDQATLEAMSAPDSVYVRALAAFEHRTAVGLATGDHLVAHAASTISLSCADETNLAPKGMWSWAVEHNDFAPAHLSLAPPLPTPLELEHRVECVPQLHDGYIADARRRIAFTKSMLTGLQSVGWRRMHLHIRAPLQHWLKLHNWPLAIRQAPLAEPSSKAFVALLASTLAVDHGIAGLDSTKTDV
ncbi:hypothetical protein SDRG_01319 [Saprolegnia diclina VS20]|uniref:DUF676 domain-containing protein n=1 Tax=Saprolegnia diclina (strain VS20) TaxID=1156394 RepID=T0R4Q0_SAPDV|nr:hypothetical protein SDRG_01319 [Saprolegnia diclina VS20]EQC41345.1 hypothetical protein SDRG_01319 [Saprolegnia diclina VS20]|eukprot:XP_008605059.1 hypothetical protein SDRG_01319 [Saprolegnia diclina VS20]